MNAFKKNTKYHFTDAVIAVTYRCNSRCIMCNIWQIKENSLLTADDLRKLPVTLRDINISGGEPFMRSDLPELIRTIVQTCPRASLSISSNGFMTDYIIKQMREIIKIKPNIMVALSLDGMGKKHDEVRRIPNGFNKVIATLKALRAIGIKNLRIGFTAGDYNIDELPRVYRLSRELGVELTLAAVHNSEHYFRIDSNKIDAAQKFKKHFGWLIRRELKTLSPKRAVRSFFTHGLLQFVLTGKRVLPNYSGYRSFYLDPNGEVYPSNVSSYKLGNIKNFDSLDELIASEPARQIIARHLVLDTSWMICTVRTAIKAHPFRVIAGIFGNIRYFIWWKS